MLSKPEREQIIALIKREVVPAIGCTEPIAVALCVAKAREILGTEPEKVSARLSANILKNAMGVGIPGTGMIGLPIAIALGALVGRSEYQLEVLKDSDAKAVERGKRFIEQGRIDISLKEGITEKLYIEIEVSGGGHSAVAIIAGGHTNFVFISRDGETLQESRRTSGSEQEAQGVELNLRKVFDFAMTTPLDEIRFILEAKRLNKAAAEDSFKNNYGHCVGNTLRHAPELRIIGDCALSRILSYTCAACDARMAGAMVPVMSNSGSGNQGIATTLPVVVYAEEIKADEEHLVRALVLSHLTAIYIKQSLGRLSALCGCVVAATGSSCGITYLMGGGYEAVSFAVKNMIANLTGMMCDGAKPSCSLKLMTGVSTAVLSAMLAMENHSVSSVEGIIDDDVDKSIRNLTLIGRDGMNETDHLILKIPEHNTAVCACIAQTQTVRSGEMVRLRLLEEAAVDGVRLPRGTSLYGEASLDGVRLRIVVRSIRYQGRIFPLEAAAYDLDGQPGLNIPDSRERRAVKEALADIGQQTGTSIDISRNAGQQVLADISRTALRATTQYAAEKLKEVKITLKADHRIYLLSKE